MRPWTERDRAQVPDGGELKLMQRGHEFSIMSGAIELMNSRRGGSEEQLAILAAKRLGEKSNARILIGGLGMGFTLRAALSHFPADSTIVVAELVPAVIAWAKGLLSDVHGESLTDPRVALQETDVAQSIARDGPFDAILLDVDNGPDGLSRAANDQLYTARGLAAAKVALSPGGLLAIWSSGPDAKFVNRLKQTGLIVEEIRVRAGGARHLIWVATKR
ncbi:spermidine synthase [Pelagibacterium luteolum]|uniref:Spermidine synthase n=1 Tax=Pelagibacterium luteolum TaxID=440168 RepID=A0A1G7RXY6_9HYPH|nr:spermidine synthase [Pelagibacterium luteolum]SDG15554.1 spermidine synthase [Pelagibacterium luteolum]